MVTWPPLKAYDAPPAARRRRTLGNAAAAKIRLVVWCLDCRRQAEPDPAEMAARHGAETAIPEWHRQLICSGCGGRRVEFVATGERR